MRATGSRSRRSSAATSIAAVEEITGREVANYHSQIVFGPTRAFEIFTLRPES